jgi:hypothetical protein
MKISDITINKVKSFLQGYSKYYYDNIFGLPEYIKEQVYFRLYTCKDTCLVTGECEKCTCPTIQKSYATEACSNKFPDLMSYGDWNKFKKTNEIPDLGEIKGQVDDVILRSNYKNGDNV